MPYHVAHMLSSIGLNIGVKVPSNEHPTTSSSLLNREPRRRSLYHRFNSRHNLNNSNNCETEELPYVITNSHHYYWPIKSLFYQDQSKSSIFDENPKGVAVDILGNCLIRPDILVEKIDLSDCQNLEVETFYAYQVTLKVAVTTFDSVIIKENDFRVVKVFEIFKKIF